MTERKPASVNFESWVEQQIRAAMDRGDFDNLPGAGKPLDNLDVPYDEVWLQRKLRAEGVPTEELLPTPLKLRKEIEQLPTTLATMRSEDQVRDHVTDLDQRIRAWLRAPIGGPNVPVAPLNIDTVVERWRTERPATPSPANTTPDRTDTQPRRVHTPWWRRIRARRGPAARA